MVLYFENHLMFACRSGCLHFHQDCLFWISLLSPHVPQEENKVREKRDEEEKGEGKKKETERKWEC